MTAGTSSTAMVTSTSAMPSTPKAMCTPNALIQFTLNMNWKRSPEVLKRKSTTIA